MSLLQPISRYDCKNNIQTDIFIHTKPLKVNLMLCVQATVWVYRLAGFKGSNRPVQCVALPAEFDFPICLVEPQYSIRLCKAKVTSSRYLYIVTFFAYSKRRLW